MLCPAWPGYGNLWVEWVEKQRKDRHVHKRTQKSWVTCEHSDGMVLLQQPEHQQVHYIQQGTGVASLVRRSL